MRLRLQVSDGQNGKRAKSSIVKALKKRSIPKIAAKRRMMVLFTKALQIVTRLQCRWYGEYRIFYFGGLGQ